MADPRNVGIKARASNLSPLMRAKAASAEGEPPNFCPFGCDHSALDDHGACFHLVGYTTNGRTMEPRVRRPEDGRVITDGSRSQKLKPGDQMVRITSTARVYRAKGNPDLMRKPDEEGSNPNFLDPEELELQQKLVELQNPKLDGVVNTRTSYDDDDDDELEAATRPGSAPPA